MAAPMLVLGRRKGSWLIGLGLLLLSVIHCQAEELADATEVEHTNSNNDGDVTLESVFPSKQQQQQQQPQTESASSEKDTESELFSLTSLVKSLLNPVIEEFQVGTEAETQTPEIQVPVEEASSASLEANATLIADVGNVTVSDNSTAKNESDTSKKYKFECVGRNVTDNTTLEVRVVNSTTLLEVLSFDKNRSSADCVIVMFYAPWCQFCAKTAPHYNALARAFPQLEVLAVDAVHFSNLNARFGTVAVPNVMLFHQSRSAVRFNHTERVFQSFVQFIKNVTGLEANTTVNVTEADYIGPLSNTPTLDQDYLLWVAWVFVLVCSSYMFVKSPYGQQAINRVAVLWQEHQHIE